MYDLLLYAHILGGVVWVGGAVAIQALAVRIGRSDPAVVPALARHMEGLGKWLFLPASLVIIISGVAMTIQAWSFGEVWIAVSVALWVASAVAGALYLGPRAKRAADTFEAEGPTSVTGLKLIRGLYVVSRLELVSFAVIIALMVFKPGS